MEIRYEIECSDFCGCPIYHIYDKLVRDSLGGAYTDLQIAQKDCDAMNTEWSVSCQF